jgi:hypothetical protein
MSTYTDTITCEICGVDGYEEDMSTNEVIECSDCSDARISEGLAEAAAYFRSRSSYPAPTCSGCNNRHDPERCPYA